MAGTSNKSEKQGRHEGTSVPRGVRTAFVEKMSTSPKDMHKLYSAYLPAELVGGSVPHIPGNEVESVWNAAAQACGTERVHFVYTVNEDRCWYLATPSSALASAPDSWCPLAAALPGNSEYWDKETVYLFEREGFASALRWDKESGRMQIYLGAARTILPKVQSMDANFVTINADTAKVVPWQNIELKTDMLARSLARILTISGMVVALVTALYILTMFAIANTIKPQLEQTKAETEMASMQLLQNAMKSLENNAIDHIFRIQELLDTLVQIEGTLVRYEVSSNGQTEWEALVPRTFSAADNPLLRGARPVSNTLESDGRVRIRGTN